MSGGQTRRHVRTLAALGAAAVTFFAAGMPIGFLVRACGLWNLSAGSLSPWLEFLDFLVELGVMLAAWMPAVIVFYVVRGDR